MKKSELDLSNLKNSFSTFKDCYLDYSKQTDEKVMNKFLKKEYDKTEKDLSINNIFREMYGLGLIKNFENWAKYREQRNTVAHEYDIVKTYPIIDIIPEFIADTEYFITNLEKVLTDD